jgi:hypothetical protein
VSRDASSSVSLVITIVKLSQVVEREFGNPTDRNRGSDGKQKAPPLAAPPLVEDVSPDRDRGQTEEERETVESRTRTPERILDRRRGEVKPSDGSPVYSCRWTA